MFALLNLLHSQTFQYKTLDTTLSLCTPSSHRSHFRQIKPVEFKYNKMETLQASSLHMCVQSQRKCQFFCYSLFRLANGFRRTGGQFRTMPTVCWRVRRMLPAWCCSDLPILSIAHKDEHYGFRKCGHCQQHCHSCIVFACVLSRFAVLSQMIMHGSWTQPGTIIAEWRRRWWRQRRCQETHNHIGKRTLTSFESARVKRSKEASGNAGRQSAGIHF